ncbi:hypothetical protein RB597_010427 [Gaeumannomyces tritici]
MDENHRPSAAKQPSATPIDPKPARPLYSSKLGGDGKARALQQNVNSPSPTTRQAPVAQQKAWAAGAKNPLTGRSSQTPPQNNFNTTSNTKQQPPSAATPSPTNSLREGQRVRISLNTGAEFEGIYANNQADPSTFFLRMVQQRRIAGDMANGANKPQNMTISRKDVADARPVGGNANKNDAKTANGNRPGFRTDSAISNTRQGGERALQPWQPDGGSDVNMSLESSSNDGRPWDQFAANERLFNVKTNYHENIYTTTIDKSHPQYKERLAAADKKAREIERSAPATAHVAEERVMDFAGGDDKKGDEEDKYSGVRRQDVAALQNRENKYTPPARRAPAAQATSYGAPVDPAIISAQLKGGQSKKAQANKQEEIKAAPAPAPAAKPSTPQAQPTEAKTAEPKTEPKVEPKPSETKPVEKTTDTKTAASLRPSAATGRNVSPQGKPGAAAPSATSTVEHDVLKEFKNFAIQQRVQAEKVRTSKAKADAHVKLQELKKFANSFKLSTPVPSDLISIIAKDPAKQKAIQEKALQNAEEVAKSKTASKEESAIPAKEPAKATKEQPAVGNTSAPHPGPDNRATARPGGPQHAPSPANPNQRHQGGRQPFAPGYGNNGQFRGDRSSGQYGPGQGRAVGGTLGERLRRVEQERHARPVMHPADQRQPPTGPAHGMPPPYDRRMQAMPQGPVAPKLNPNSHEFRPNPFATTFNPNMAGPSNSSSPRPEVQAPPPIPGQLIRRKTKAIDAKKCYILSHIQTFTPPPQVRSWDENEGLRPSFDTLPTWRQLQDDEKSDSTMHMTYSEYLEKLPYSSGSLATPNPPHTHPQMAHQHQLPFHLQHGAHNLAPRQSPHMPPMQMHGGQHGHVPHVPFNGANDDHNRMMHSNSAQSYASPRISQVPIGYPPPTMGSPAQLPYNQGVMPPFMPGTPQMNNFRSFSNNPQYMPQQNSPMTVPLLPSQFLPAPNGLVAGGPQMSMYAGAHQGFVPHGGAAPPQPIPGSTGGYPSPGRPAAPMMSQQGSQQGQPMYGVSPNMQFQQPVFPSGHPGHMNARGGYNGAGPQQFGTSPQQMHNYGNQHRNNSYGGNNHKNFQGHGQGPQQALQIPSGPQGRQADGPEEAK